jgi:single-strand DNA-binding protein
MNNLNSVLVEGTLVKDALYRVTPKGVSVCTFSIASKHYSRSGEKGELIKEVHYFEVQAWSRLARGKEGRKVRVVGQLRQDRCDGVDGKSYSKVSIVADHIEFRPKNN